MIRIIQNHRCQYDKDPTSQSGWTVIVRDIKSDKIVGIADPFPQGKPALKWRQEKLIKESVRQVIENSKAN